MIQKPKSALSHKVSQILNPKDQLDLYGFSYVSNGTNLRERMLINMTEIIAGRRTINRYYREFSDRINLGDSYWQAALDTLSITLDCDTTPLAMLPQDQPLVVIANHPYGVVDGLAICRLVSEFRPNFKILLNENLCRDNRIAEHVLPVNFANTKAAIQQNIQTKRAALETLKTGGTVIIFPAGGVATTPRWFSRYAEDLDWKPFAAKLIQKSQASVMPVYFYGQNSRLFQCLSHVSMSLRLGLYVREVKRFSGRTLHAIVGNAISFADMSQYENSYLLDYLRETVFCLPAREKALQLHG